MLLVVRVPEKLMKRIDAEVRRLSKQQPGVSWSRSAVVRELLNADVE